MFPARDVDEAALDKGCTSLCRHQSQVYEGPDEAAVLAFVPYLVIVENPVLFQEIEDPLPVPQIQVEVRDVVGLEVWL